MGSALIPGIDDEEEADDDDEEEEEEEEATNGAEEDGSADDRDDRIMEALCTEPELFITEICFHNMMDDRKHRK